MAQQRVRRGRMQALVHGGVELRHHVVDPPDPPVHAGQELGLPAPPVRGVGRDEGRDLGDGRPVGGPEDGEVPVGHLLQTVHVGGHVTARRRDHRGRPAHDVVAGEQGVLLVQGVADVVQGVARGGDSLQGPARPADHLAAAHHDLRLESLVLVGLDHDPVRRADARWRTAMDACARPGLEGRGEGRMVRMVVGDEDVSDRLARRRGEDGLEVLRQVRARINDGHLPAADDEGGGAEIAERPGIVGHHAADQGRDLVAGPVLEGHVLDEGDHGRAHIGRGRTAERS